MVNLGEPDQTLSPLGGPPQQHETGTHAVQSTRESKEAPAGGVSSNGAPPPPHPRKIGLRLRLRRWDSGADCAGWRGVEDLFRVWGGGIGEFAMERRRGGGRLLLLQWNGKGKEGEAETESDVWPFLPPPRPSDQQPTPAPAPPISASV
jgi:hypothetical protein